MPDDETQLDRIERKLDIYGGIRTGNGKPERGHVIRVDRLEGRARRSDRIQGFVVAAVVFSIVGAVLAAVIKGQT